MTVTPQDCIVHWLDSLSKNRTQAQNNGKDLLYQEGKELKKSSSEGSSSSDEEEPTRWTKRNWKKYTIYIAETTKQPLILPKILDVRSLDELEDNISAVKATAMKVKNKNKPG